MDSSKRIAIFFSWLLVKMSAKPLSPKTVATYERILSSLQDRYGKPLDFDDTDGILALVRSTTIGTKIATPETIKSKINAIKYELKRLGLPVPKPYNDEFDKTFKGIIAKEREPETYEASEKHVDWERLSELYQYTIGQPRVALALYSLFPPRRLDYINMHVVDKPKQSDKSKNYLVVQKRTMKFIFNTYKTKESYGSQTFTVPKLLQSILRPFAVIGKPLLQYKGAPFTDSQFSEYMSRITSTISKEIGEEFKATANTFRHSFVTHFLKSNPTTDQRMKTSEMMAHSIGTQLRYDRRED